MAALQKSQALTIDVQKRVPAMEQPQYQILWVLRLVAKA